jgi:hypothetical protein
MRHPARRLPLVGLALLLALGTVSSPAQAANKPAKKGRCAAGKVPVLKGTGKAARPALDRKGKLRCAAPKKVSIKLLPRPSADPGAQMAAVADGLDQALSVVPAALAPLERRLGAKRTRKLQAIALDSWRPRLAAATAARAAALGPRAHAAETKSDSYSPVSGGDVKFTSDFGAVDDGTSGGYRGSATVEGSFSRGGLEALAEKAGASKLPPGVEDGKAKLELTFADLPRVCPDARGKVKGTLKATGRLALTVGTSSGPISVTLAAEVDVSYALQVGDDARWKTIDDVDVRTTFSVGGTGRSTETWRGRRTGTGFGHDGILGSENVGAAIDADFGHFGTQGGNFGPKGGINFSADQGAIWDLRSIDNVKGLIANNYASAILTLAALEYIRKVAADRVQKSWYDDEKCLKLQGVAADAKLRPGQTTTVTAKNARAADGAPVATSLTATGVALITPGSAQMPAGASSDFRLTAPGTKPAKSSWKLVALSRAGKKTVSGDLDDSQGPYTVTLDDHETGHFATHDATGHLTGTLAPAAVDGASPQRWTATGSVTWSELTATSKTDCGYASPVAGGTWGATITALENDRIRVELTFSADALVTWTVVCEGASIPGQAGVTPLGMTPLTFELSAGGGIQPLGGSVQQGGDGFFTNGTLTVAPTTP